MNIGKAVGIYKNINSDGYSMSEKIEAIKVVVNMNTHNGISKNDELAVAKWLADRIIDEDIKNANNDR